MGAGSPEPLPVEGLSLPSPRLGRFRRRADPQQAVFQRPQVQFAQGSMQGRLMREPGSRPAQPVPQLGSVFLHPLANAPCRSPLTKAAMIRIPGVALTAALAGIGHPLEGGREGRILGRVHRGSPSVLSHTDCPR
jgi:hypothetical protein